MDALLKRLNLSPYLGKLKDLGASTAGDLKFIEDADLTGIGMKLLEIRKLKSAAAEVVANYV